MTEINNLTTQQIHEVSLGKRMLQGAVPAFLLIVIFLIGAGEPRPEWGKLWMIKPLVITPLAGALGSAFYYFMDRLRSQGSWTKTLAILLSLVVYLVAVWLGFVLGLNGTWWN